MIKALKNIFAILLIMLGVIVLFGCGSNVEDPNNDGKDDDNNPDDVKQIEYVNVTFLVEMPKLEDGDYEYYLVLLVTESSSSKSETIKLDKDNDKYKATIEIIKGLNVEYNYMVKKGDFTADELTLNGEKKERTVMCDSNKEVQDSVERFKDIKLASEVEVIVELVDSNFYDNDRGAVHTIVFNDDNSMSVSYKKTEGKTWACIIRPLEDKVIGRLSSLKITFIGEKDVEYLFKVEGGDGNQEETVVGTGEVQEYVMKINEEARNSSRLVIFGHRGITGTSSTPITGEYKIISILATLKDPEPELPYVPGDNPIHILAIGNSFSDDGLWLLYDILKELGYDDIIVANLYIGGCSVATHKSNLENDSASYTYRINKNGEWVSRNNYKASTALEAETGWDYISLQQASDYSGLVDNYVDSDISYIYKYALDKAKVKNENVKLVWHMTWAYQQNSTHQAFVKYNKDQMTMYNGIINAVKTVILNNEYQPIVVPSGTTIQNLRTTFLGDTITRDGYHLNEAYGRYGAALTWAITLTGKDVSNVTRPASVLAKYDLLCKECAKNAVLKPFEVTESQYKEDNANNDINYDELVLLDSSNYIIGNGYYNSQDSSKFLTPIQDGSNFCNGFITTKLFTKDDLPVGSVIVLTGGYQYRPEGWIDEARQANRNPNTTEKVVVVDEAWWGSYIYRAFNISKVGGGVLTGEAYENALANFKIYVPKN